RRPERTVNPGRYAECRRAYLCGLADQYQNPRSRTAATELIDLLDAGLMLAVDGLCKRFGGFLAVNQVSFEVRKGEILGLIGPNGSGKSTTFNLIAGTLRPTAGSIRFEGEEIGGLPAHIICRHRTVRPSQLPTPLRNPPL